MRSLELLGLACFNTFLGLTLTVTFMSQNGGKTPSRLTETSVTNFITEMTDVALGKKPDLDQYGITTWFMDHIDDSGKFITTMNISQPTGENKQETLEMNRMDYISYILKDIKTVKTRESTFNVEYVKIDEGGKSASVVFTNMEKASVPISDKDGEYMIPVTGTSYCEQTLALRGSTIKVSNSTCTTNVSMSESY